MALTVFSNIPSLTAQRSLSRTQDRLNRNLARLSSGLRVNSAADDAAGMAIAQKFSAQIRSNSVAERNTNDGISMLQTADSAMSEVGDTLSRMRELAVQASSGTLVTADRRALDQEFQSLKSEIDRVGNNTDFNSKQLLNGTLNLNVQVGIGSTANDQINVTIGDIRTAAIGTAGQMMNTQFISTTAGAANAISSIDAAIADVSTQRGRVGAYQNRFETTVSNLQSVRENLSAAHSRIMDVDVADESSQMTRNSILREAGVSILAQANMAASLALRLIGQ